MTAGTEIASTIDAGGIKTNYHDQGAGRPVLLIHGSGPGVSAWANWRPVLSALSGRFRVVAPDILGFGYTERPAGITYTIDRWLKHLCDFLDALNLQRVSVVGNSFGAALAMKLATTYPNRVASLVLMGSAGIDFPITKGLDAAWGYTPSIANMRRLLNIFTYNSEFITDELARLRYQASTRPGVQEAYATMFPAPRQSAIHALALPESNIRRIGHETLVVHGRDDQVIPLENSTRLHRLIEKSQLHVFGQCGHWVQIEHTARFVALVSQFLGEDT